MRPINSRKKRHAYKKEPSKCRQRTVKRIERNRFKPVIADADVMPPKMLKSRMRKRPSNAALSGKRRKKMLRNLRYEQADKAKMEVCLSEAVEELKSTQTNNDVKNELTSNDVEMTEET